MRVASQPSYLCLSLRYQLLRPGLSIRLKRLAKRSNLDPSLISGSRTNGSRGSKREPASDQRAHEEHFSPEGPSVVESRLSIWNPHAGRRCKMRSVR